MNKQRKYRENVEREISVAWHKDEGDGREKRDSEESRDSSWSIVPFEGTQISIVTESFSDYNV